jgi:hypothetical protein
VLACGQPLEEAAGAAFQRDDLSLLAMHLVNASEAFAVERPDMLVAKVG